MTSQIKLLALAVTTASLVAACNGGGLPNGTGTSGAGAAGFSVRITKSGQPQANRKIFLKKFNGANEGDFQGSSHVSNSTNTTDSQGYVNVPVDPAAIAAGALFGIGYDATSSDSGNDASKIDAQKNPDEIQFFTTPAINLSNKTGQNYPVSFDLAWNTAGFTPTPGATLSASNGVNFNLAPYSGATAYEININTGTALGSGSSVARLTSPGTSIQWPNPTGGTFNWSAKATIPGGVVGANTTGSAWSVLTVQGGQ